jgi:uncharacterized repeat protein (TIGR03803 family)
VLHCKLVVVVINLCHRFERYRRSPYILDPQRLESSFMKVLNLSPVRSAFISVVTTMFLVGNFVSPASAQTYGLIHSLLNEGDTPEGYNTVGALVEGLPGLFIGTTVYGGAYSTEANGGPGVVFSVTSAGGYNVLHNFDSLNTSDGASPEAGLIRGGDLNYYGTTQDGGQNNNSGTVVQVTPTGQVNVLHSFDYLNASDGDAPVASLVLGPGGYFYGTTAYGGQYAQHAVAGYNGGIIFKIDTSGNYTVLHSFNPNSTADGNTPVSALVVGTDGNLYGTTSLGGLYGNGTVFEIAPDGTGFKLLHSFNPNDTTDGAQPDAALVVGSDGTFYGTTVGGGQYRTENAPIGYGTVFSITSGNTFALLHSFNGNSTTDGNSPETPLILAGDGNLYGTTYLGGLYGDGTIFEITPTTKAFTQLHSFMPNSTADGYLPESALLLGSDGSLYGTTELGGLYDYGTIYKLTVPGAGGTHPPPTVTSFTPSSGPVGTSVTITGTNFTGATAVLFSGTPAATFTVNSAVSISVIVPAGATTGTIAVTTAGGKAISGTQFNVTAINVSVKSLVFSPAVVPPEGNTTGTITLSGAAPVGGAPVVLTEGTFTIGTYTVPADSATTTAPLTFNQFAALGVYTFTATYNSTSAFGTVLLANPPGITSFTPSGAAVGTSVVIAGGYFTGATSVSFHGTAASFTVNADTSITAVIPTGATTGTVSITTPGGTTTSTTVFFVTPSVKSLVFNPDVTTAGSTTTGTITLSGPAPTGGASVVLAYGSITIGTYTVAAGSTFVTAPVTVYFLDAPGIYTYTASYGNTTASGNVTIVNAPSITAFTPASGTVGTSVAISGMGFTGATAVSFDGTAAASFTVNTDTSITATVPTGATTGTISIIAPGGTATSVSSFTITVPVPTITSLTPTSGPIGTSVTVTGKNFTGATAVSIDGYPATFQFISDTSLTFVVPSGAATGTIHVKTSAGLGASTTNFTVTAPAGTTITSFTPTSGPIGTSVTVTGKNFTGATAVSIDGYPATFKFLSDTSLTFVVPSGAATGAIHVKTSAGLGASTTNFTVTAPVSATVTSFTPASGAVGSKVTVTGTGFTTASAVSLDGYPATYTVINATTITFTVPVGAATGVIHVKIGSTLAASATTFVVVGAPMITGITPGSGPIGTVVAVTGSRFTGTTAASVDGYPAAFVLHNDGSISVTVPKGASTGAIHIKNPQGLGASTTAFTVTM